MKKYVRFLIFTILIIVSAVMTSCIGSESEQDTDRKSVSWSEPGVFPIVSDDTVELTVWAILSSEIDDYSTNFQSEWYEEYSGVKIKWINVPVHGWADAFQLSVMNGDYPDIYLYDFDSSEVDICAEYGAIIPLGDLIEENCPNISSCLEAAPDVKKSITALDGNIYTLFVESYNMDAYTQKLWVNREWLGQYRDSTGAGMPETVEEFENMLVYFRDHDMNGNGDVSDEIPYMGCSGVEGIFTLMGAFVPSNSSSDAFGCVMDNDGNCCFSYNTTEFREALKYLNRLYEEKLLSDQTFTISMDDRYGYTSIGQSGSTVGVASGVNIKGIVQLGNSEMDYTSYIAVPPLEGPDGVRTAVTAGETTVSLRNAITSACKYPEIAVKWLDYWYSEEGRLWSVNGGQEGVHWFYGNGSSISGDGEIVIHADNIDIYDNFCWSGKGVAYMIREDDFTHMDMNMLGNNAFLATYLANEEYSRYSVPNGWPQIVWATEEMEDSATEYSELVSLIENYVAQHYTEFILGRQDINDDIRWEEYIQGLEELGLDRYMELIELYVSNRR